MLRRWRLVLISSWLLLNKKQGVDLQYEDLGHPRPCRQRHGLRAAQRRQAVRGREWVREQRPHHYLEQLHRKSPPRRAARRRRAPRGAAGSLRSAEKSISGWLSRAAGGRAARSCTRYSQNK